jgi:cob(I)alamin adenosyltransferase
MSICTKTGDLGTTGLMYNRRVSKTHPRVEACGAIDELNSALGLARASSGELFVREQILPVQKMLIVIMGEIATVKDDLARYRIDGYEIVTVSSYASLETLIKELEAQKISFKGWATPGATLGAAHLDLARSVCRRAERRVQRLLESGDIQNGEILVYFNRLSDALWLLARWAETRAEG